MNRTSTALLLPLFVALGACAATDATDSPGEPAAEPVVSTEPPEGVAPYPYTPDQIRDAMPVGLTMKLRIETGGEKPVIRHQVVTAADATRCTMEMWSTNESGTITREKRRSTSTWVELRNHASFPVDSTVISRDVVDLPSGRWSCDLYTVTTEEGGVRSVSRYWFADAKPGMPVRYEMDRSGRLVFRLTLLEQSRR